MRFLTYLTLVFAATLAVSQGALGAPPALLAPSAGVSVGEGAALIDVRVATSHYDRGIAWGWRVVASTNPAVLSSPWPFAQLDYSALNHELNAIRSDYAARGMLYSSFYVAAVQNATDRFFQSGLSADFNRNPVSIDSGVSTAVGLSSGTSAQLYLDRPGMWHIAVATATESRIEWSTPVTITVAQAPPPPLPVLVPAPASASIAPPATVPAASPPASAAPTVARPKPAAQKASVRCRTVTKRLRQNARQVKRARIAARKAKTTSVRRATRAKVKRLTATRARIIVAQRRAC